ncbi:hypothetical protein GALMADRAFT_152477 [Galerina marginata CBS 339.88]|uniref:Protein transport protein sec16 n=1 Tax=Galerina marginata (strain CBS 339.88) TaxID=685588 RepID=A0A067TH05_GALM3|nr:hypothetical protein GALMADRAFT_152477 [Galerina marginata CBS 339.88]
MNGVEAASSLFGSEESGSDLFASLGTESTSPQPPLDDFFSTDTSSLVPESEAFDFSSHIESHTVEPSAFPEYTTESADALVPAAPETALYSSSTNTYGEQYVETSQSIPTPGYSTDYPTQQAEPAPATSYNSYAPSTYSAPLPSTTAYSSYSAYDPPAPASSYTPYATNSQGNQAYTPQVVHSTVSQPQYNSIGAVPPIPTPVKSTVTRPKVSNAYDPPFISTLPSRRTSRTTGGASQVYNNPYQSSLYASTTETSSTYNSPQYSSPQYQQPAAPHDAYRRPSVEASQDVYSSGQNHQQSSLAGQSYVQNGQSEVPPTNVDSAYNLKHSTEFQQPYPSQNSFGQAFPGNASVQDNGDQAYTSNNGDGGSHAAEHPSSPLLLRLSSLDFTSSLQRDSPEIMSSESTVSPRTLPLPYSPPTQKGELQELEGPVISSENVEKQTSHPSPYVPYQGPRKDLPTNKELHDPYAPKANTSGSINNYIPRTSSPLSVYNGRSNDTKKPPVVSSHVNGVTSSSYSSVPRPLVGIHESLTPSKAPSIHLSDDQVHRQIPHWSETKPAPPQDIIVKATSALYAPSPSLIGANDPLSRTSAHAPVVTFGFGGKMVTCFHGMPGLNAGFDVALSSRTSSELKIHILQKILPESALNSPGSTYPGPLFSDPGMSSLSLVRPGQASQAKTKKTIVLSYLSDRASEIHQGLGYLTHGEKQTAENKLILVKLLGILVENDGRLLGTPQSDSVVRTTLVPRLEGLTTTLQDAVSIQGLSSLFLPKATTLTPPAAFNSGPLDEAPISVTTLRPSTLDKIEELLLQGNRRQAYQFAMDQKLWAHAMIIASSIDKESWKEVVNDFLRTELGAKEDAARGSSLNGSLTQPPKGQRDSLRVAYSLFSGQGAAAVQELVPINMLQKGAHRLQAPMLPAMPAMTPRTPNFPSMQPTVHIPPDSLVKWAETAAMIISSPLTPETSGALTALGDQLLTNNWVEAAHACFLLSSQTSVFGGLGSPAARIVLVGSKNHTDVMKDADAIIFSEILEFALSLVPAVKGQEPYHGLPHLQAYRFIRAVSLAETGDIQLANRYCEAIAASLTHGSPYTNVALLEQLQGLQQRLSGVFHGDKSASWIGGKLSKPSLDTIGGWLEGRFTKLVTGDSDSPTPTAENSRSTDQPFAGPFAHYSTISSTTPSARSSPQPPSANLPSFPPPQRTTSAMATSTPYSQVQIERSSSAMEYMRQKPSVLTSKNATSISSSQSSPTAYGLNGHSRYEDSYTPKTEELETPVQVATSWWGSDDNSTSNNTPTAATFMQVDESSIQASSDGFISLMDSHSFAIGPHSHSQQPSSSSQTINEEDDNDLGLGNSRPKTEKQETETEPAKEEASAPANAALPAPPKTETQAPAGGWLSRLWKRSDSTTPGPIKASLGEESAFYYDKEQKRWVNKKAGAEEPVKPAAPPPPPSRAQTASPGMTGGSKPQPPPGPPPPRSASAIDLSTEPPTKVPMRIRSNLAPPTESAPSTPTGTRMLNPSGLPPPGRPKSGAAKRNIRSRYVDVFQEGGGAA